MLTDQQVNSALERVLEWLVSAYWLLSMLASERRYANLVVSLLILCPFLEKPWLTEFQRLRLRMMILPFIGSSLLPPTFLLIRETTFPIHFFAQSVPVQSFYFSSMTGILSVLRGKLCFSFPVL